MIRLLVISIVFITLWSCKNKTLGAQKIVDAAINASGGEAYQNLDVEFDFRDKHYRIKREGGAFQYERHFKDSLGQFKDVLNNIGFQRFINDSLVEVADSMAVKYTSSVNSVSYFALLPFGLNDAAVNKKQLEDVTIKGNSYYKIEITFDQDGGGEDFEDVFIYWINKTTFTPDYIAYSYNESDGVGMRFREAFNPRFVGGIRFVDYNNYKANSNDTQLYELDQLFEANALKLVSKIENKNIKIN